MVASTVGQGNAGKITINAADTISADGIGSGIFSTAGEFGEGDATGSDILPTVNAPNVALYRGLLNSH